MPEGKFVVISDLRMGVDPDYAFTFHVADVGNPHAKPVVPERIRTKQDYRRLIGLWERL